MKNSYSFINDTFEILLKIESIAYFKLLFNIFLERQIIHKYFSTNEYGFRADI
jgi:hypothetical protein